MGKGRVKGVPNKTTTLAKNAIADAAEKLGGTNRIVEWAKEAPENERMFWGTIYPKLLPLQLTGGGPGDASLFPGKMIVEFVDVAAAAHE